MYAWLTNQLIGPAIEMFWTANRKLVSERVSDNCINWATLDTGHWTLDKLDKKKVSPVHPSRHHQRPSQYQSELFCSQLSTGRTQIMSLLCSGGFLPDNSNRRGRWRRWRRRRPRRWWPSPREEWTTLSSSLVFVEKKKTVNNTKTDISCMKININD